MEWDGIHLGRYKGNDLVYAGKVDHGFTPQSEKELHDGFGVKLGPQTTPWLGLILPS